MFNVLLDKLPTEYKGYPIDPDFQIGIQIFQCLNDPELSKQEAMGKALSLLFLDEDEDGNILPAPDVETAAEGLQWFLSGWYQDKINEKDTARVTDYDVDQWRIYSAFKAQYGIDLNTDKLHFWAFMGLLTTLDECAYTRVISIRQQKIEPKMSAKEKQAIKEAKRIYSLDGPEEEITAEELEAIETFRQLVRANRSK